MAELTAVLKNDPMEYDLPEFEQFISQLAAKVKEIGEANPDYRYKHLPGTTSGCYNTANEEKGRTSCIVGRAIGEVAPKVYEVLRADEDSDCASPYGGFSAEGIIGTIYLDHVGYSWSNEDYQFVRIAQGRQDSGDTWGQCVRG